MPKYIPEEVIKIAMAEVGYLEKKNGDLNYLYSKTANAGYNNYTKYGYEMHKIYPKTMDYPASYCDCFVDWCFYKAYGVCNAQAMLCGNFDDYTVNSAGLYKNKNAWYTKNPKVGDQIFFKNSVRICHTGLVYKVDSSYVYTIEANTSSASGVVPNGGAVVCKKYSLSYSKIAGYGRPKYANASSSNNTSTSTVTTSKIPEIAPCKPVLAYGSKGESVKLLQKDINYINTKYNLKMATLTVDGMFGNGTKNNLKTIQSKNNITSDGEYGNESYNVFLNLLK